MARAQNSYMAGSTSPSSLIHTACFFGVEIWVVSVTLGVVAESFVTESTVTPSAANEIETKSVKRTSSFDKIFISSMYKVLFCTEQVFVKKNTIWRKRWSKTRFFLNS